MRIRFCALVVGLVAVLGTGALTYAANQNLGAAPHAVPQIQAKPKTLLVPDVRRQAYVFAKGMLEDSGFAWRVKGGVQGFAANLVATQTPAPGTRVLDNGAPTILLTLARNAKYGQKGTPEDAAPYAGTPVQLADLAAVPAAPVAPGAKKLADPKPAATPVVKPAAKLAAAPKHPRSRPPAFTVAGAPKEPLNEMPLPDRARLLARWLGSHPKPTDANVKHWLFQHEWIVQGARFGWWRGAEALKLLIADDRRAERVWGIGAKSASVAQATLAEVEAK